MISRHTWLLFVSLAGCSSPHDFVTPHEDAAAVDAQAAVAPTNDASFAPIDASDAKVTQCQAPPNAVDPQYVTIAAKYAADYTAYDLGPVPGVDSYLLGGCVIAYDDPNTLYVAVASETTTGAIYAVPLVREPCGHIVGFAGPATLVASTPYVDANLIYGPNDVLFYSMWPVDELSELLPNQSAPSYTAALSSINVGGGGPGGIGFVPPNLSDPGGLRAVTWPSGYWYHLTYSSQQQTYAITSAAQQPGSTLPNGPGGFAYVPAGSPQFAKQSIITAEWPGPAVAVYEVDSMGDPIVSSRDEFFTQFPKPWGAYFEPATGDFMFLSWGGGNDADAGGADEIYIVQGFTKPPPPPTPK